MANFQVKDPKAVICIIFAVLSVTVAIAFFLLLFAYYFDEYPKISTYAETMCKVNSSTIKSYTCSEKNKKYSCYDLIWKVYLADFHHISATIEISRYKSYSSMNEISKKYKIDESYSCWYDTRNRSIAQWHKPSLKPAIIFFCVAGVSSILSTLFILLSIKLVQRERSQGRNKQMNQSYGIQVPLQPEVDMSVHS